jgi:hypothetical protein
MADWSQIGKTILVIGVILAVLGGAIILGTRFLGAPKWLGRLPGDIRIERKGFSCYFPLATSILLSLLLTVVLNIIARLLRR